jgi:tripartite-type tricarboxylate transporter receptor subunit TctC
MGNIIRNALGAGIAAVTCWTGTPAHAQAGPGGYPSKPVRLLVGLPAGGGIDVFMREIAHKLSDKWGQPIVVDNRPGAGTIIAMDAATKAAPDGYTLLAGTNVMVTNMILGKVSYDIRKALEPVIKLTSQPYVLIAGKSLPANSIQELVALAKTKAGGLSYASSGSGTASHLGMELLKYMAKVDNSYLVHVPYKGVAQGINDMLGGRVDMMFSISITATPLIKSGKVKALGITAPQRSRNLPDLPTIAESGLTGYSLTTDYSIYTTGGTPAPIVAFINKSAADVMNSAEMRKSMEAHGSEPAPPNSPADFRKNLEQDIVILEKFIKASGFKGE